MSEHRAISSRNDQATSSESVGPKQNAVKRSNRYLRALFVKAAWVVLVRVRPKQWERYGLKSWIEAAKKRLPHNVLY
jgi:hypothetical protein